MVIEQSTLKHFVVNTIINVCWVSHQLIKVCQCTCEKVVIPRCKNLIKFCLFCKLLFCIILWFKMVCFLCLDHSWVHTSTRFYTEPKIHIINMQVWYQISLKLYFSILYNTECWFIKIIHSPWNWEFRFLHRDIAKNTYYQHASSISNFSQVIL